MQRNVLIVDDEASLRHSLAISLLQRGFGTIPCENGINALKKLELHVKKGFPPDIMVVDIKLPDIDGIKLIKIVNFKYPSIPIIIITGYRELCNAEDMQNLTVSSLLEKPFSADDIALQFEKTLQEKETKTLPVTIKEKEVPKVVSAYILLRLDDKCDFFNTYRRLHFMENTVYCDSLRGDYDICMLLHAQDIETLENIFENDIKGSKEIKEAEFLEIRKPIFDEITDTVIQNAEEALSDGNLRYGKGRNLSVHVCAYVLIEIEKEKLDKVYPTLCLNENVVYCDYTSGKFDLILFIQGSHYEQINRIIENKIIGLDGILRVKKCPILNFLDM
ncbi:response regulator [Candidatus Latescibacterota bacterium]